MQNFIVPKDMTDEQVNELGIEITMSIVFNALLELPTEQVEKMLEHSRQREVDIRTKDISLTQPNDVLKSMMYQTMSISAMHNILSEMEVYRQQRAQKNTVTSNHIH